MAISIGNRTASNSNPNGSFQAIVHSQDVGADGFLLVSIVMANTTTVATVSYGTVLMTQLGSSNFNGLSQNVIMFGLVNPPTGTNTVFINFNGNQFNSTSVFISSFLGSSGASNYASNGVATSPHSQSLTISANSIIYATGISNNAQSFGYDIGGTTVVNQFFANTNKIVEGALGPLNLPAGVTDVTTKADFGNITNTRIEILETSVTPPVTNTGNFFLMF